MEEKTMWELQWLFLVMLLVVAGFLGVVVYAVYRVRADIEQIVRSHRSYNERFDEIESMLRDMDFRLGAKHSNSMQPPGSDAWSEALKALDSLEDEAPQLVIEDSFSSRASREKLAERASAESARREHSS